MFPQELRPFLALPAGKNSILLGGKGYEICVAGLPFRLVAPQCFKLLSLFDKMMRNVRVGANYIAEVFKSSYNYAKEIGALRGENIILITPDAIYKTSLQGEDKVVITTPEEEWLKPLLWRFSMDDIKRGYRENPSVLTLLRVVRDGISVGYLYNIHHMELLRTETLYLPFIAFRNCNTGDIVISSALVSCNMVFYPQNIRTVTLQLVKTEVENG